MKNYLNYKYDIVKSRKTPLLIELKRKDLLEFSNSNDINKGLEIAFLTAEEIYNAPILEKLKEKETTIIYIEADKVTDKSNTYLLEQIIDAIDDSLHKIYGLDIAKEGIKTTLSVAFGGVIPNVLGDYIDKGVDFIANTISDGMTEEIFDFVIDKYNPSEKLLNEIEERIFAKIEDTSINILDEAKSTHLYLSFQSKELLKELSKSFKKRSTPAELFQLIIKIILVIAVDIPISIFVKNPHKLDKDSIAIISLLLSYSKDIKDKDKHTGVSIIYVYEDENFQPYQECNIIYDDNKKLLSEQRLFAQRYSMLERPNSDIPHIAVKSTMFVGRKKELENLNQTYNLSKKNPDKVTLNIVSAYPGIGKTALVKKHFAQIRKKEENGLKLIQLTLLNQVGHMSSNTGISSLIDSILNEAQRLDDVKTFTEKAKAKLQSYAKKGVSSYIQEVLGVNRIIDIVKSINNKLSLDQHIMDFKISSKGNIDNQKQFRKEELFQNLNNAISKLQTISDKSMPIVLFIDDLQWIDDTSCEYILTHFIKHFNVHIVSTLRPSDANTMLEEASKNQSSNEYKIALLKKAKVENEIDSNIDTSTLIENRFELEGLDEKNLTYLISKVIEGDKEYKIILATTIIDKLTNSSEETVNTLFAVETLNMLCDEKFYINETQLIMTDLPLRFNQNVKNFQELLNNTFDNLYEKYGKAFEHPSSETFGQNFNLMSYAVLEERLNILQKYFARYGKAAVNTLLFSSFLGTPFNSSIVKNLLEELSTTNEKSLQPLREYINGEDQEVSLTTEHYEIIVEVYEILSRYVSFNNTYEYKHSLFHIFLEKRLDYVLNDKVVKNLDENYLIKVKDTLFSLTIEKIEDEHKGEDFYDKHTQSLNTYEFEHNLFFSKMKKNVLKKGYENNPTDWVEDYSRSLNNLAFSLKSNNRINEAIALEKINLNIMKKLYEENPSKWNESYIINNLNIANSYYISNQVHKSISLQEDILKITKLLYQNNPDIWVEKYTTILNDLSTSYHSNNQAKLALKLEKESLLITKSQYQKSPKIWVITYTKCLVNLAYSYSRNNQIKDAILLQEEALEIRKIQYIENPSIWVNQYTNSLNNLACDYQKNGHAQDAILLQEEALNIREELYKTNNNMWVKDYTTSLLNLAFIYKENNRTDDAIKLEEEALVIIKEQYEQNPNVWEEVYSTNLSHLVDSYKSKNKIKEALTLQKKDLDITEGLYTKKPSVWTKSYAIKLNNLAYEYIQNNQNKKGITLLNKVLAMRKDLYEQNPSEWVSYYVVSLSNSVKIYWDMKKKDKSIHYAKTLKSVCEKNDMDSSPYYNIALRVLEKETLNKSKDFDGKYNESFSTLLLIAKGISHLLKYSDIGPSELHNALCCTELNKKAIDIFTQIYGEKEMNNLPPRYNGHEFITLGIFNKNLNYTDQLKDTIPKLKDIFKDENILRIK